MDPFSIDPISNKKAYMQIILTINNLIKEGKLVYGQRLYNEKELTEKLEVSRPTLREALRVLEFIGIITVKPRKGIIINNPKDNQKYWPLEFILTFEKISMDNLWDLRRIIETDMANKAAENGTDEEFNELGGIIKLMLNIDDRTYTFMELDNKFHMTLLKCAHNDLCYRLINSLRALIYEQQKEVNLKLTCQRKEKLKDQHYELYEAIVSRNGELAKEIMNRHLSEAYNLINEISIS